MSELEVFFSRGTVWFDERIDGVGMHAFGVWWSPGTDPYPTGHEEILTVEVPFLAQEVSSNGNPYSWNGMVYTRGAADDFDRYGDLTEDEGWSWSRILPYFLKNEKWTPPADDHNTNGQFDPAVHGTHGPISVSLNGFSWSELEDHVIQTTKELPDDFPFNSDMNSGQPLGIASQGWMQSTIGGGERSSSATGYLGPHIIQRPNLHVLLHAQVSRLVNGTRSRGSITFEGGEFQYGTSLFIAKASKEIILSAGAIGSPRILLNSGIGCRVALRRFLTSQALGRMRLTMCILK
ncbi:GMC oxidoreductase-domain-containing protein [Mycena leptocephala]|nr:GMC oxidoreductase-domain-containing protein [Mycena leptocephala]